MPAPKDYKSLGTGRIVLSRNSRGDAQGWTARAVYQAHNQKYMVWIKNVWREVVPCQEGYQLVQLLEAGHASKP